MKKLFLIILLFPLYSYSQPSKIVIDADHHNVCILLITFKSKHGTIKQHAGYGFIVNNRYLVTVAHVFSPFYDTLYVSNILVRYQDINNQSDSVYVNFKYKYTKNQFNFYTHPYDTSKSETDFSVLKLEHKVKTKPVYFSTDPLNIMQPLYSAGYETDKRDSSLLSCTIDEGFFLFNGIENTKNDFHFIVCIGYAQHGSSGSPLFNQNGGIVGIIQSGWDKPPLKYLDKLVSDGIITFQNKEEILKLYGKGLRMSFALGIDYIQNHYLKGFL